ncbi:MAG: diguanylate cyclase, partial [Clostridiales bacterium]|nr:diguanylate cyclase [Clostridiales bacterium]
SAYAQINPGQAFSARKDDPFLDMAVNGIWWIDADGNTDFITGSLAKLFGYLPDEMHAKSITAFLQAGDADTFIELLNSCADGQPRYQRLGFVHKNGSIIAMQIRTHTIFGASRHFAGLILNLEDTANLAKTEKALFYRLSMEEMIADISSRFVGIKYKKIDGEIVNSLKKIEEFMGVRDSSVQLTLDPSYEEKAPGTADILIWQSSNSSDSSLTGVPAQPYKSEESLTIPLLAGTRPIGVFRCTQSTYTKEWMSEDIRLIQLAGEIFINAITGRENQLKLILSEERLRVTLNSIGDAIIAIDENNVIQMFNSTAEHLIGINKYNALGKYLNEIFITRLVLENPEKPDETSYTKLEALDGQSRFISVQRYPITDTDKNIYGEIIIFSDVSEKKKREDEIRYISFHDTLTNLYNRVFFEEEMRRLDVKRQHPITIIMGDCNGLKITNDVFGHYEGDRLLVRTAEILLKSTRKEDVVARWGGDEFVIILPKTDEKTASQIRERILETCENTDMHPVKPSLALGSATKADDSVTMDTLLKEAEERMYRHKLLESKSARNSIISSFEKMLYERNYETEEHAKRMQDMAHSFGLYVGLSDDELDNFCLLAALHDIGKIGIPDHILLKPGELSSDEWAQMKKHSEKGFSIANSTGELNNIADLILYHHERWDGTGYPQGLRGEEIPRLARMLSVIDAYDVITHARPYKEPLNKSDALLEIEHCASTQFDPALVKSFVMLMRAKDREAAYQS